MDIDRFLPGIIGSFVGVVGWLLVGVYMQRRGSIRQAKNAGRAVYFELDVNRLIIGVARDHGSFVPLSRSRSSDSFPSSRPG